MSLGILVARLGEVVGERTYPDTGEAEPATTFSGTLRRIRDEINHHAIPLVLLAQADGQSVAPEQAVILRYCLERLDAAGMHLTSGEEGALADYLRGFRPTRMQLAMAIRRLADAPKEEVATLVAAMRAVIAADREYTAREADMLADIDRELAAL
jgi:hypothetical protein